MEKENNFDLVRLLAAIQVMWFHTVEHLQIDISSFNYLRYYPGVIIFFTVSGYLIYLSLERNKSNIKKYLFNRIGRIYPALWFSTLISFLLILVSKTYSIREMLSVKGIVYWVGQLSFFQFWTPNFLKTYGVGNPNGSLWTIVVELQFYIVILCIFKFFNKKRYLILIFLLSIIINYFVGNLDENIVKKLSKIWILPYLYNFIIGMVFAKYKSLKEKLLENKVIIWLVIYNIWLYFTKVGPNYFINIYSLISNILLSILCLSFVFSFKKISFKLIKNIDISYGLYLFHMIYLNFFIQVYGVSNIKINSIIIYVLLTFLTSYISHRFIEKPSLDRIKKLNIYKY